MYWEASGRILRGKWEDTHGQVGGYWEDFEVGGYWEDFQVGGYWEASGRILKWGY